MAIVSRYIVERAPDQVQTAFQGIVSVCASKGINSVTLVVPQKGGWDRSIVAEFLKPIVAKALLKGQSVGNENMINTTKCYRSYTAWLRQALKR